MTSCNENFCQDQISRDCNEHGQEDWNVEVEAEPENYQVQQSQSDGCPQNENVFHLDSSLGFQRAATAIKVARLAAS